MTQSALWSDYEPTGDDESSDGYCTPPDVMECIHRSTARDLYLNPKTRRHAARVGVEGIALDPWTNNEAIAHGWVRARTSWTLASGRHPDPMVDPERWPIWEWSYAHGNPPYSNPHIYVKRFLSELKRSRAWGGVLDPHRRPHRHEPGPTLRRAVQSVRRESMGVPMMLLIFTIGFAFGGLTIWLSLRPRHQETRLQLEAWRSWAGGDLGPPKPDHVLQDECYTGLRRKWAHALMMKDEELPLAVERLERVTRETVQQLGAAQEEIMELRAEVDELLCPDRLIQQTSSNGLNAVIGQWPGDESDESLL